MATKPTFVAEYETAWNTDDVSVTAMNAVAVNSGDKLVAFAVIETWLTGDGNILGITENGTSSWTEQQRVQVNEYTEAVIWTYDVTQAENLTVTFTRQTGFNGKFFGGNVLRFSGSDGFGASAKENGTDGGSGTEPSLGLTTTADNSAIVQVIGDWTSKTGSRTYRTVGSATHAEVSNFADGSKYGVHGGYYDDVGTAGAKTVGMSAPVSMKYSIIALEVKGTAGGAAATPQLALLGVG